MISSTLNEFSTNESSLQSPDKSNFIYYTGSLLPQLKLNLQKFSEKNNLFLKTLPEFSKNKQMEKNKEGEIFMLGTTIYHNLIEKNSDKKSNLLDFDFLVGEILDKINTKNNMISSKIKKIKKVGIKKGKTIKLKKYETPNRFTEQKSKYN